MTDDLRSTLESAVSQVETKVAEEAAAAPPAPAVESPAPAPDTAKVGEPKAVPDNYEGSDPATPETSSQESGEKIKKPEEQPDSVQNRVERAPQSWKPAQKAKWDKIDPDVRQEIIRREREVTRTLSDSAAQRKFVQGFQEALKPFAPRFQSAGIPPAQAIQSLLHVDRVLATAPAGERAVMMAKLIKDYGIDIGMLDTALTGVNPAQTDPEAVIDRIVAQRMAPVQQMLEGQRQQTEAQRQAEFQQTVSQVEAMSNDPKYPLMDLVREDMADIIEINSRRGVDVSLVDAYNRAVNMNPEARTQMEAMASSTKAQQANSKAQRALGASLSVSGSPAALRTNVPATDLRGTLEAAMSAATGRVV